MEFLYEDCKTLLEQVNLQEKELRNKRRLLIGLPASRNESGKLKESKFQPQRPLPEYLLREDDVNYETIRSFIKNLSDEHNSKNKYNIFHEDMQLTHSPTDITTLLTLINDMTNQALFQFAKLLTNGTVKFEKTRWKMKQIIKEHLSKNKTRKIKLSNDHLSLLKNPQNFQWNPDSRFIPDSNSALSAVHKILSILEDLPFQTLSAMHRKLRGITDYIPKLFPKRSGWNRDQLIKTLRKKCLKLLLKHNKGDLLQERLVKSMEVAGLTLKLILGHHYAPNFIQFPPEIIVLQNEIAKCIKLLDQEVKLKLSMFKKVLNLLDPDGKLSRMTIHGNVKNFLMEYLFECSDLSTIPKSLLEVLAIVRKSSKGDKDCKMDEEVECILSVSGSMKQVLWDVIPDHEFDFDFDFADVYMEDLEESDDDYDDDGCEDNEEYTKNNVHNSSNLDEEVGSTDEIPVDSNSDSVVGIGMSELSSVNVSNSKRYHMVSYGNMDMDLDKDLCLERNLVDNDKGIFGNKYLGVQGGSDEVSMVAYSVIGQILGDFAKMENCELNFGDLCYLGVQEHSRANTHKEDDSSIMIKAVEEIIPSFAKSEADRLRELMSCKRI